MFPNYKNLPNLHLIKIARKHLPPARLLHCRWQVLADQTADGFDVDRLHDIVIHATVKQPFPYTGNCIGSNSYDRYILVGISFHAADVDRRFLSVHHWHMAVHIDRAVHLINIIFADRKSDAEFFFSMILLCIKLAVHRKQLIHIL